LYLRPNEFDAEKKIKVGTSGVYELCWTAIAIGTTQSAYFKTKSEPERKTERDTAETAEKPKPQNIFGLVRNAARTTEGPGSPGDTKGAGNYPTSIRHALAAKLAGLAGIVYSDANGETVRECSAASVLFVKYGKDGEKDTIVFPNLKRSDILGSITMKTIWETAEAMGYNIVTQDTKNEDIDQYDECLIVGTAAGITTAHKLEIVEFAEDDDGENFRVVRTESAAEEKIANGKTASYDKANLGKPGRVAQDLNTKLCEMKRGEKPEYKHYLTEVPGTEWATKSH
jgi:branched-subunit amino acid aminotransferase/4-amino-4-deoxychorismate lyase